MLKKKLQHLLRRLGAYDRLRESFAYDCYRRLRHGRPLRWRHDELLFYRTLLAGAPEGLLVFDVGAHRGQRSEVFLRLGARVVAVEPDALNQRHLERRFSLGGPHARPVTVVGKAASDTDAGAVLRIHAPGSGLNSLSEKWVRMLAGDERRFGSTVAFPEGMRVETTTLESLMDAFGAPYYVKIDVEGHEPSVLRGLKRPVPFLSFEVNLPEFLPEGAACAEELGRLSATGRFNWAGDPLRGLAMTEWLDAPEFARALRECGEPSVEVFWKSGQDAVADR